MLPALILSLGFAMISVGEAPPEWKTDQESWQNTEKPLTLESLRGKVVLIRWFTEKTCPYCKISAPALNGWHEQLAEDGLVVIGLYHHKRGGKPHPQLVARTARGYGFQFPYAVDPGWATLNEWWMDEASKLPRKEGEPLWTSVSVLIGRDGKVAYIHPGGSYKKGDTDYIELDEAIRRELGK